MKVLPDKVHSTVRDGSWLYAIVESYQLGLSTVRLGANGEGARLTNLFTVGIPSVGDMVIVDFSASRPYVRCLIMDEEIKEEELPPVPIPLPGIWKRIMIDPWASKDEWYGFDIDEYRNKVIFFIYGGAPDYANLLGRANPSGDVELVYRDTTNDPWMDRIFTGIETGIYRDDYEYISFDGGLTWETSEYRIYGGNLTNKVLYGNYYGNIAFSLDSGRSWQIGAAVSERVFNISGDMTGANAVGASNYGTYCTIMGSYGREAREVTLPSSNYVQDAAINEDGSVIIALTTREIWKSTSSGYSWNEVFTLPPDTYPATTGYYTIFSFIKYQPKHKVWIAYGHDSGEELPVCYYSFNDGDSWEELPLPLTEEWGGDELTVGYLNGTWFKGGNTGGFLSMSTDNGETWQAIWGTYDPDNPNITEWDDPDLTWEIVNYGGMGCLINGETIVMEAGGYVLISKDLGVTWHSGPCIEMSEVYGSSPDGQRILIQSNNTGSSDPSLTPLYISSDAGDNWYASFPILSSANNEVGTVNVGFDANIQNIYAHVKNMHGYSTTTKEWTGYYACAYSFDGGHTWEERPTPWDMPYSPASLDYADRAEHRGLASIAMSGDGKVIYIESRKHEAFLKSTDTGYSWEITEIPHPGFDALIYTNYDGSELMYFNHDVYFWDGSEWHLRPRPLSGEYCYYAFPTRDLKGLICRSDYRIFASVDGGENWQEEYWNQMDTEFWKEEKYARGYCMSDDKGKLFINDTPWAYLKSSPRADMVQRLPG